MDKNKTANESIEVNGISFSKQELNVISALTKSPSYKEVSKATDLSLRMVMYHINALMKKTNASSKEELIEFFRSSQEHDVKEEFEKILKEREYLLSVSAKKSRLFYMVSAVSIVFLITVIFATKKYFWIDESDDISVSNVVNFQNNYLNRYAVVEQAQKILSRQDDIRTVVIVGAGGAGKTTLGREVLSSTESKIKFEINAETEESLNSSYLDLAEYIAVSESEKNNLELIKNLKDAASKKKSLIRFVSGILKKSSNWALLFDNVVSLVQIKPYLPLNPSVFGKGTVIITTRNENIKETNFIADSQILDIGGLSQKEKRELFCGILFRSDFSKLNTAKQKEVDEFLQSIPELPLDVCAVAYYLRNTKVSMDTYKEMMKNSFKKLDTAQGKFLLENADYSRTRYGIVSSAFREILKDNETFKSLLFFMCLMDSQNIPKKILRETVGVMDADDFINRLKQNSLIADSGKTISIHRSTQSVGLDYMISTLSQAEKEAMIVQLIEYLCRIHEIKSTDQMKLLPHAEALSEKLFRENFQDLDVRKSHIRLLVLIGDLHRQKTHKMLDSLKYLKNALKINSQWNCLDNQEVASIKLKIGEVCTIINENTQADIYLSDSLKFFTEASMKKVRNYRLLGIIRMRQHKFEESNKYFISALNTLKNAEDNELKKKLSESNIYEDMSFNYFMDGINRENARKAVPLMEKAIEVLEDPKFATVKEVISRKAVHKIKLAGIHNALAHYQKALEIAQETENLLKESGFDNSDTFYVQGLIARERGLAHLRLNKVAEAYDYFEKARKILTKLMKGDYLFKIKMHEAECLVRLDRLDEAFVVCEDMFATKDRERNNYANLFFNTCYYHAAIIKYRQKDFEAAKKYFQKFFESMKVFCREIASEDEYDKLEQENAFDINASMEKFFKNSLKVFEVIYWKDYEFTKYYVEDNLKLLKR